MQGVSVRERVAASVSRREWLLLGVVVLLEVGLVAAYFLAADSRMTSIRYTVYPLLWITVGIWVVVRTDPPAVDRRGWLLALAVAVAYASTLLVLSGMVSLYGPGGPPIPTGVTVGMASPGWGPRITVVAETFHVVFVPYRAVGYVALTYLVYARTAEAVGAVAPGALGLVSCLGCAFPILSSLGAGVVGTGTTSGFAEVSVDLATAVFLLAVALLYWWPAIRGRVSVPGGH